MSKNLEFLKEYIRSFYDGSIGRLFDNMSFISIGPLFVAFLIAFFVIFSRIRAKGRNARPEKILRMMFSPRVFLHESAKKDYFVFIINNGFLFFVTLSVIITPGLFAETLLRAADWFGISARAAEATFMSQLIYSTVLVLAWDFGATYAHYLKHKVPFMWEFHKVHHSAEVMTPVTAMRRHPIDYLFSALITTGVLGIAICVLHLVFGFGIQPFTIFGTWAGIYIWRLLGYNLRHSHIWISYGDFWNKILVSPAQHQVHHSTKPKHFDKNFGHIFAFWDTALGSQYLPKHEERVTFGIEKDEMEDYRTLKGLYLTPFVKVARRFVSKSKHSPQRD